jgi:hypothetical protein
MIRTIPALFVLHIPLAAAIFMAVLGIEAIRTMSDYTFAYLILVVDAAQLILLWFYRREFRRAGGEKA